MVRQLADMCNSCPATAFAPFSKIDCSWEAGVICMLHDLGQRVWEEFFCKMNAAQNCQPLQIAEFYLKFESEDDLDIQ